MWTFRILFCLVGDSVFFQMYSVDAICYVITIPFFFSFLFFFSQALNLLIMVLCHISFESPPSAFLIFIFFTHFYLLVP